MTSYIDIKKLTDRRQPLQDANNEFLKCPPRTVLVVGSGDVTQKQLPAFKLLHDSGAEVLFADSWRDGLGQLGSADWISGENLYEIDGREQELRNRIKEMGGADLIVVNNAPSNHLTTSLAFKNELSQDGRIVLQKPQDTNFPLVQTLNDPMNVSLYAEFMKRTFVHDHYRNKSVVPGLYSALASAINTNGRITKMMFFVTEPTSMVEQQHRAHALKDGMIQDLAVHSFDIFLETLIYSNLWQVRGEQYALRTGARIDLLGTDTGFEIKTAFPRDCETFSAIDIEVTEHLLMDVDRDGRPNGSGAPAENKIDVLFVQGKGVVRENGDDSPLKSVVVAFEDGHQAVVDLNTLNFKGLPIDRDQINTHHGGLNRPYMLLLQENLRHATKGFGGRDFPQFQQLHEATEISKLAYHSKGLAKKAGTRGRGYAHGSSIGKLVRGMIERGTIRNTWNDSLFSEGQINLSLFAVDRELRDQNLYFA